MATTETDRSPNGGRTIGAARRELPSATRRSARRNRARVMTGVAVIAVCTLAAALLYGNLGDRRPVVTVARAVPAGHEIAAADLARTLVAADADLPTIPYGERSTVIGRTAAVDLSPGALLVRGQLSDGPALRDGEALVGATLKPGQYPSGLRRGDRVLAVLMPPESATTTPDAGTPLAEIEAVVLALELDVDSIGGAVVSLAVPAAEAARLSVAGARGRLALVVVPR